MRSICTLFFYIAFNIILIAQPNCNVFLWEGDTLQYEACKLSQKATDYYQFDMKAIAILDSVLTICPHFADASYEYAVVYLKAGNFIGWNKYINEAVKYDPITYLGLRASCRGKFFADYQGAIDDIDSLASLIKYNIGYVHDGAYHLEAYKALCYKALGKYKKAIGLFEKHLINNANDIGLFDYLHLGVAYQTINNHEKANDCFAKQQQLNDLAENNYYTAISYLELNDLKKFEYYINRSEELIKVDQKMTDGFHVMEDEIFISDILNLKTKYHQFKGS